MQGGASAPASKGKKGKKGSDAAPAGASSVSSGVKLENVSTATLFLITHNALHPSHLITIRTPDSPSIQCQAAAPYRNGASSDLMRLAADVCSTGRLSRHQQPLCSQYNPFAVQISITFKNQQVLKDVSWDVKKGEKVGLVGVNGAGKTTQLQIITGALQPDAGNVIKAKDNMRIAYLTQEFDVTPSNTVREEFMSAFGEQVLPQCCCLLVTFAGSCNAAQPMLYFTTHCKHE